MMWLIIVLWMILTIINVANGGIGSQQIYIAGSIILAAEYIAEEIRKKDDTK